MTNYNERLDEILTKLARETTLADRAADMATTADGVKDASKRFQWSIGEAKQSLLDWHNKQIEAYHNELTDNEKKVWIYADDLVKRKAKAVEELLDRLEQEQYSMYNDYHDPVDIVPVSYIEAERAKLKEVK